ncbi:hypothetical protein [Herbaspirillum huttiense]|uniref:Uncharacterized protein n=2 Tax=Herbaspirillum huttiense TaxID=863372 RepID=A0AAJ2HEY5_9BURK|nr:MULTISPECIES: hypothetical protein [Herbaspirillum]MDR9837465.1 hypothetical protein [Herbaspirillum huttiense]UWE15445.1 hypothetical protein NY669_20460 [Herbaspirillum huttiense]
MSGNDEEDESKRSFYFQFIFENVSATLRFFETASCPMMSFKPHSITDAHFRALSKI